MLHVALDVRDAALSAAADYFFASKKYKYEDGGVVQ